MMGAGSPKSVLYGLYERRLAHSLDPARLPHHVGVILDGHRRFARAEGLSGYRDSYRAGVAKFEEFLGWCHAQRIPAVTAWVLSTDNLQRPPHELHPLFDVLGELCDCLPEQARALDFSVRVIGHLDLLPADLASRAKTAADTASTGAWQVTIALAYGGRQEVVDAAQALVQELLERGIPEDGLAAAIDSDGLARHLYQPDTPDPDLIIRTSGASRLSGFLLWQSAYAEFVFVDPFWPAFRQVDFLRALRDYQRRTRRFGR